MYFLNLILLFLQFISLFFYVSWFCKKWRKDKNMKRKGYETKLEVLHITFLDTSWSVYLFICPPFFIVSFSLYVSISLSLFHSFSLSLSLSFILSFSLSFSLSLSLSFSLSLSLSLSLTFTLFHTFILRPSPTPSVLLFLL